MRQLLSVILALLLGLTALSLGADSQKVTLSGSTSVLPLAESWAEEFNKVQSDYQATVRGGGTGVGIQDVATGKADIGMASRSLKDSEKGEYGDEFTQYIIAKDCICLAVSEDIYNAGVTDLTQDEIKGIYDGEITNWNEVGGPDEQILCIAREVGSGTRDFFNEHFFGSTSVETPGVDVNEGSNAAVATSIGNSGKAIGYIALSYINAKNLHVIAVDGEVPSMETAKSGSYPVVRDLYMYTYGDASSGAKAFLDFAMGSDGQEIAKDMGYPPAN